MSFVRWSVPTIVLAWLALAMRVASAQEADATMPAKTFEPEIRADQMRPHVELLASPKLAGRGGEEKADARKYIVGQWRAARLQPLFASSVPKSDENSEPSEARPNAATTSRAAFEQPIRGAADDQGTIPIVGHNVGAWLPGSDPKLADEFVIVSAHYDGLGTRDGRIFAGADDNASGVAMLIEVARQLAASDQKPKRSVVFLAFDLEERLLWGSRWFAAHPPWPIERVKLFLTADMIGRSLGDLPFPAVFVFGSENAPELKTTLDVVGTPPGLEVCRLGTDMIGTRSDYGAFRDREIPFLFFSTGEHPDYHSPRDTPDKVDYEKAARIASLMLNVTRRAADADASPVWSTAAPVGVEEARVMLRITTLLLDAEKDRPLTATQRFLVTNVQNRSRQIIAANQITPDDRAWLVRMSQLLLFSVF
jgi:Peptidase family M28